jgi:Na+/melibiose symporter-like transporter
LRVAGDPVDSATGVGETASFTPVGDEKHTVVDKILYGLGSIAFGVKDNGFAVLLLLFYNQALGVPAAAVGLAIMIALMVDAVADPFIGNWSDGFRSKLGRRHPFMYAAALPIAVTYFFLWNPPQGLPPESMFWYLLVMSTIIRICISFYEIPSSALVVDLAQNYDVRTSFLSYRYFFGWVGGLTMGVSAFSVFLRPGPNDPTGQLNLQGYSNYGLTASLIMLVVIVISSLGTQRYVATFRPPPPKRPFDPVRSMNEAWETLRNRAFAPLLVYWLFGAAATGIGGAALTYFRIYFWELSGDQISFLMIGNFASVVVALFLAPRIAAYLGKKRAAIAFAILGMINSPAMYLARLLDIAPDNGSPVLYWLLFGQAFLGSFLLMSGGIVASSMLADVVEDSAVKTGRHSAGLLFSVNAFILKAVTGIGVMGAGFILSFVNFPEGAAQGSVPEGILVRFAIVEPAILLLLQAASLLAVLAYPITRARHEQNLRALAAREMVPS